MLLARFAGSSEGFWEAAGPNGHKISRKANCSAGRRGEIHSNLEPMKEQAAVILLLQLQIHLTLSAGDPSVREGGTGQRAERSQERSSGSKAKL